MAFTERYVRDDAAGGGDGTTNTNSGGTGAWTLAEAISSATSGMRINMRTGTYTLAASITLPSGATENPIIWQGFNSSIADLETVGRASPTAALTTANFPVIDGGASYVVTAGAYNQLRNIKITSAANAYTLIASATATYWRCSFENTHATGGAVTALGIGTHYIAALDCDCVIASNNASAVVVRAGRASVIGCRIWNSTGPVSTQRGIHAEDLACAITFNLIFDVGIAISVAGNTSGIFSNTWYNVVTGIFINGAFTGAIANNVGWLHSGYAIRGTTSSGLPLLSNNAFGSHTSGRLDTSTLGTVIDEIGAITLTADPFTNSGSDDFTLNDISGGGLLCKAASGLWGGHADLGAVQTYPVVPIINTRRSTLIGR